MTTKDWVLLLTPLLINGVLLYIAQQRIIIQFDNMRKRRELRDSTIRCFLEKTHNLNSTIIYANANSKNNLNIGLQNIRSCMLEIIEFYDTNQYDLNIVSTEYEALNISWNKFTQLLISLNKSNSLSPAEQIALGKSLQQVKESNLCLISLLRNKY